MKNKTHELIIRNIILNVKGTKEESIVYAKEMKAKYPNKQDYGYGAAGHTLNNWEDMKEFFLQNGPVSYAKGSHKTISQTYRKIVGRIIDNITDSIIDNNTDNNTDSITDNNDSISSNQFRDFSPYLGHCCWSGTVEQLVSITKESWLKQMIAEFPNTSPHELSTGQKTAWGTSFSSMKKALCENPELKNALLVFEYALPRHISDNKVKRLIWPDVLIVTKRNIVVLEFKNKLLEGEIIDHFLNQAQKYKRRLMKYHVASRRKGIDCILVSTKMKNAFMETDKGVFCSGDQLGRAISESIPYSPRAFFYEAWLNSRFIDTKAGQKAIKVRMKFDDSVMETVKNKFGDAVQIRNTAPNTCVASVVVDTDEQFFEWLADNEPNIELLGPESVIEDYDDYLWRILSD